MSSPTAISIPTIVPYHPAENRVLTVEFSKQISGPLTSPAVVVQSQESTASTLPVPNIENVAVSSSGTGVSFNLNLPEVDVYKFLITATDPAAGKIAGVLTVEIVTE